MTLFEQIHGEVEVVVDHLVAKSLAEVSRNLREDVESAFRTADFQTRNFAQKRDGKVAAALESLSPAKAASAAFCAIEEQPDVY